MVRGPLLDFSPDESPGRAGSSSGLSTLLAGKTMASVPGVLPDGRRPVIRKSHWCVSRQSNYRNRNSNRRRRQSNAWSARQLAVLTERPRMTAASYSLRGSASCAAEKVDPSTYNSIRVPPKIDSTVSSLCCFRNDYFAMRTQRFSSKTTTSPRAISRPFTNTSTGSLAILSNGTTDPLDNFNSSSR